MTRKAGPSPYLRVPLAIKATEGAAVLELIAAGHSFRQAADILDMSATTCWRRFWWLADWTMPRHSGRPPGPVPPQRGTARCPRGRPWMPTIDGPGGPLHMEGRSR